MKQKLQRLIAHLRAHLAETSHSQRRLETWRLLTAAESILAKLKGSTP
jgi:hypothetical protein